MISRSTAVQLVKALVSAGLLFFVASHIDWPQLLELLRTARPGWLGAAVLLMGAERVVAVIKWDILLVAKGTKVPFWPLMRITLMGNFAGLFLPSSLSIDVVRGYELYRHTARGALSASSVLVDRILGLFSLLMICLVGMLFHGSWTASPAPRIFLIAATVAAAAPVFVLQLESVPRWVERRWPAASRHPLANKALAAHRAFLDYKRYPRALAACFIGSVLLQIVRVLTVYALALTFSVDAPLLLIFVIVPVSMLLVMIPITIGGLGVREASFVALFAAAGMSKTDAFAVSFANSVLANLVSMLGGLAYLFHRSAAVPAPPTSPAERDSDPTP